MSSKREQLIKEVYKPIRVNFPRRPYVIKSLDDTLQLDIADLQQLSKSNEGYKYFLLGVNPFSKKIYTQNLKTKSAREVCDATKEILMKSRIKFKNLHTDRGTEFKNKIFQREIVKDNGIKHFFSFSVKKCAHAERAIGTIKRKLYKSMGLRASEKWIVDISKIVNEHNNTPHSRFKFKPNDVTRLNENEIFNKFYNITRPFSIPKFKLNDPVRIIEVPDQFRKSFYPSWSPAVYTIVKINKKYPNVYKLKTYDKKILPRSYYEQELQKVKNKDYYLIEKIVGSRGRLRKCRFWGFSKEHDMWLDKDDIDITEES